MTEVPRGSMDQARVSATIRHCQVKSTILVVDDEEAVCSVARRMLESAEYRVLTAATGADSLVQCRSAADRIDAVLLDLTMPDMSGHEVAREMLCIRPDLPIVLSSGYGEAESLGQLNGQLAGFLQKPYRVDDLLDCFLRILPVLTVQRPGPSQSD